MSAVLAAGLVLSPSAAAADGDAEVTAGGRALWISGDEFELIGDLWADLAFPVTTRDLAYVSVATRTVIDKTKSVVTFEVHDLQYNVEVGWRGTRGRLTLSAFTGQRGKTLVDEVGKGWVRYVAAGVESPALERYPGRCATERCSLAARWTGALALGPVFDDRSIDATAVVFGTLRGHLARVGHRGASVEFDIELDGLLQDGRLRADSAFGPRLSLPARDGLRASFFVHYLVSRNPLGLGEDGWVVGFSYEEGSGGPRRANRPPTIDGVLGVGAGSGRTSGTFELRMLSPSFLDGTRGVFWVDGNILTADDTTDLFYLYYLGLEHDFDGPIVGAYLYHRSNHALDGTTPGITTLNVFEAGVETPQRFVPAGGRGARRFFDGWGRLGIVYDSSFSENDWHARGGFRFGVPVAGVAPYVVAEVEAGGASRSLLGAGLGIGPGLEIQLELRHDETLFSRDQSAVLLMVRYGL